MSTVGRTKSDAAPAWTGAPEAVPSPMEGDWAARVAEVHRALDQIDRIADATDSDELWANFEKQIDDERRSLGMRTRFERKV